MVPPHGGRAEKSLRGAPDHCRLDRAQQVHRAPGLSNTRAQRSRRQHPTGYALLHYLGLMSWVLAPLDAESSKLTTFITPWGAYRFRRNVMGLISAGDEHNRRGDEALAGLDNVQKVVEDVIIYDTDLDTHAYVHRVHKVIRRCSGNGITLRPGKFVFGAPSCKLLGLQSLCRRLQG